LAPSVALWLFHGLAQRYIRQMRLVLLTPIELDRDQCRDNQKYPNEYPILVVFDLLKLVEIAELLPAQWPSWEARR
jgi:hypothetical protein